MCPALVHYPWRLYYLWETRNCTGEHTTNAAKFDQKNTLTNKKLKSWYYVKDNWQWTTVSSLLGLISIGWRKFVTPGQGTTHRGKLKNQWPVHHINFRTLNSLAPRNICFSDAYQFFSLTNWYQFFMHLPYNSIIGHCHKTSKIGQQLWMHKTIARSGSTDYFDRVMTKFIQGKT